MVLEDYLSISLRRKSNRLPLLKLQMNLIQDLVISEKSFSKLKNENNKKQEAINLNPPNKIELQNEISNSNRDIYFNEMIIRAIRDISDGIAWRLFDYDRIVLSELANRPGTKQINTEGLQAELHELGQAFNSIDSIAVLNDLTHFLKIGDITAKRNEGTFEFIEVKSGHKARRRIKRQKESMHRTLTFFNTGEKETEDGSVVITELDVKPEAYHTTVYGIIKKAEKHGAAIEKIGNHLIVECIDFMNENIALEEKKSILNAAKALHEPWKRHGDLVLPYRNDDRYNNVRNFAPFSIFPFPVSTRVKLMTNGLLLIARVNYSEVLRYFLQRGWRILKTPFEYWDELNRGEAGKEHVKQMGAFAKLQKGKLITEVPWALLGQLGFEFLKPRTLVDAFEAILAAGQVPFDLQYISFSGESELWD